jgi:dTDP-4-amino-4,6-dideoxygalactose transaminase
MVDAGIQRVLAYGKYILGSEVVESEERLGAYAGSKYCIIIANNSETLPVGDEVAEQMISLPMHPFLTQFTQEKTAKELRVLCQCGRYGSTPR